MDGYTLYYYHLIINHLDVDLLFPNDS